MWRLLPRHFMCVYFQIQISATLLILILASRPQLSVEAEKENPNSSIPSDDGLIVEIPQGQIKGRIFRFGNGRLVAGFLGIPYAEPPLRELRFRPPMPPKGWDGVLNATDFRPICPQPGDQKIYDAVPVRNRSIIRKRKLENYAMSEDCLTINVYVPLTERGDNISLPGETEKLPVFFYIHGGSYYMGAGRFYPGQILASTQNLIVITFNFRLGPLGFFSSGDGAAPGNYGLLDQVQAMDWVWDNIHIFGGNPTRITLVGNSAGGASIMFHLVSPLTKDKFIGVTVQSGCSAAPWAIQPSPKKHAENLAGKLGCPITPTTDMVDCIRTFSTKQIMKHAKLEDGLRLTYAAVIDGKYGGKFLSASPDQLISQNQFHHVPILTGFTRDEVTIWFTHWGPSTPTKHLAEFLKHDVVSLLQNEPAALTPANHAAAFHSVKVQYMYKYGISDNDTMGKTTAVSEFISDVGLKAPCMHEMNRVAQFNTKPVYLYEFHYFSPDDVKMNRQEWIGSYHESELQFIFGEAYLNYSNHLRSHDDKKMCDLMMKIWANFARYGNPTPSPKGERTGLKFPWTNYTERNQDFAILGHKSHMAKYFYTDRMLFWNFFFPMFRDYRFEYSEPPLIGCDDWELLRKSWTFWSLVCLSSSLGFTLMLCISLRFKSSSGHPTHRTRIAKWYKNNTTTATTTLIPAGGVGANSPRGLNASSPMNSTVCHQNSIVVSPSN